MNQEFNNLIKDIKGNPEKVADIIFELGLSHFDLQDPLKTGRVNEVLNALVNHPDPSLLITKLTTGKQVDKVDHLWSYFKVQEQKQQVGLQLEKTNKDFHEISALREELQGKFQSLSEQEQYF